MLQEGRDDIHQSSFGTFLTLPLHVLRNAFTYFIWPWLPCSAARNFAACPFHSTTSSNVVTPAQARGPESSGHPKTTRDSGLRRNDAEWFQTSPSNRNTSSSGTPNTFAILNASSRDGEYFACSIAISVCRVTPTRSASSACVISFASNRKRRMLLRIAVPGTQ